MLVRRISVAVTAASLLMATPASAVVGEENIALAAIAASTAQSMLTLGQLVTQAQQAFEVAQLTLKTAREASEVVADVAYLSQNPNEIFDQAQQQFALSFPEIEAMARDAERIQQNLRDAGDPNAKPRTIIDLINHARSTNGNAYQAVMSFNNATYGMLDPYLKQVQMIEQSTNDSNAIRLSANGPLDSKTAAVLTAKATANAASSLNAIASYQLEVARIKQQEYLEREAAKAEAALRAPHIGTSTPAALMPQNDDLNSTEF